MAAELRFARIDGGEVPPADPGLMEDRACPLCGGADHGLVHELPDFQFFTDGSEASKRADVRQVRCRTCGLLFMNPVYSALGVERLFAEAGCSFGAPPERQAARADWLRRHALPRAGEVVLDLGCHRGEMLAHLPAELRRIGVDGDAPSLAQGRDRYPDLDLRPADLANLAPGDVPEVGVVSLFHVLEHLPDPLGLLRALRAAAGPRTRLVVEVPVLEDARAEDVVGFFTPHHTTHFTRGHLIALLARAGWATARVDAGDGSGFRVLARAAEARDDLPDTEASERGARAYLAAMDDAVRAVEARLPDVRRAVVWGAGNHTEMLYQRTGWFDVDPGRELAVVDSDRAKHGRSWRGVPIQDPAALADVDWSRAGLVVSSYRGTPAIAAAARAAGVPASRISTLYDLQPAGA